MPATKGIRLDEELRASFEEYCRAHLLDERAVIEAWLLRFLEAKDEDRRAAAERYTQWSNERKAIAKSRGTASPSPKKRTGKQQP